MQNRLPKMLAFCILLLLLINSQAAFTPRNEPTALELKEIEDTHSRLNRIYRQTGLRQELPAWTREGCGCDKPISHKVLPEIITKPDVLSFLNYILIVIILAVMLIPLYYAAKKESLAPIDLALSNKNDFKLETDVLEDKTLPSWPRDLEECNHLMEQKFSVRAYAGLHHLLLSALAQYQFINLNPCYSNGDYQNQLARVTNLNVLLAEVTKAAEQAVWGRKPPASDLYWILQKQVRDNWENGFQNRYLVG